MDTLVLRAPAKINWALRVTGRRFDGYHSLQTVFQSISLTDDIRLTLGPPYMSDTRPEKEMKTGEGMQIRCFCRSESDCAGLRETNIHTAALNGPDNLAYKAAELLGQSLARKNIYCPDITIHITKRIPLQAGLAGGSSDAAAVLRGVNSMLGNPLDWHELRELACCCGSDTSFCLRGGTQWGEGTGNELTFLPSVAGWPLVIVKPEGGVSTRQAFEGYDKSSEGMLRALSRSEPSAGYQEWYQALVQGDMQHVARLMENALEPVSMTLCPSIAEIKKELIKAGSLATLMSGSGSAVFGLVEDEERQENVVRHMRKKGFVEVWAVKTTGTVD